MKKHRKTPAGFTLIELMVSMIVLTVIMMVSVNVISTTQKTWSQGSARVEQFREARMAFESITQSLRQATLNTYMTYKYNNSATPTIPLSNLEAPQQYLRYSELQFITGPANSLLGSAEGLSTHAIFFQAPLGVTANEEYISLDQLLCGRGYFIMHGDDSAYRPAHITENRYRFRLMEYRPAAEKNSVYNSLYGGGGAPWYSDAATSLVQTSESADEVSSTRPVAENILALIISPQVAPDDVTNASVKPTWIAPNYSYDSLQPSNATSQNPQGSQHMLPPQIQVTLVAIDEASARRLAEKYNDAMPDLIPTSAFTNVNSYEADLTELETKLREEGLSYRVFSTTIGMRNAKWTLF